MIEVEWFDAGGEVARFPDPLAFGKKNRNLASGEVETLEDAQFPPSTCWANQKLLAFKSI